MVKSLIQLGIFKFYYIMYFFLYGKLIIEYLMSIVSYVFDNCNQELVMLSVRMKHKISCHQSLTVKYEMRDISSSLCN